MTLDPEGGEFLETEIVNDPGEEMAQDTEQGD